MTWGSANGKADPSGTVVVGAGLAGLEFASALAARTDGPIWVLESGPDSGHRHYRLEQGPSEADALWLEPERDVHFWRPYTTRGSGFGGIAGLRRRVGGRSLYWHGAVLSIERWAFDSSWPLEVVHDLCDTYEGGASLYESVRDVLSAWCGTQIKNLSHLDVQTRLAGRDFVLTPRAVREEGERWGAYSPLDDLPAAIRIVPDTHVGRVITQDGRVVAVEAEGLDGVAVTIPATRVVLAAGTIENTRLAIASGAVAQGGSGVEGLVDKVAQGLVTAFDRGDLPSDLDNLAAAGSLLICPGDHKLRSSVMLGLRVNRHGLALVDLYCLGEQVRAAGCVSTGEAVAGQSIVECELGDADQALVGAQQGVLQEVYDHLSRLSGRAPRPVGFDTVFGSADLGKRLRAADHWTSPGSVLTYSFPLGSELHEAGTLALGGREVDGDGQMRSVAGLYVLGACTFPRTGSAHPTLTVMALAHRLAGLLGEPRTP